MGLTTFASVKSVIIHSKAFLARVLILMVLYTFMRICFYALNRAFFPSADLSEFIYGFKFDLAAVALMTWPLLLLGFLPLPVRHKRWYQELTYAVFLLILASIVILEGIDLEYFKFTLKRSTGDLLNLAMLGNDLTALLPTFLMDFWYVALLGAGVVFLFSRWYRIWTIPLESAAGQQLKSWSYYAGSLLAGCILFGVSIWCFRGGSQLRPMSPIAAAEYTSPNNVPLVLNTTFSFLRTLKDEPIEPYELVPNSEVSYCFNPLQLANDTGIFKGYNVMVIILESFSRDYIGYYNNGNGYTPFLDSLFKESWVMTNCFANGKKSIEALPAIMAGLPSLMTNPYITSLYSGNRLKGYNAQLESMGYSGGFFHGGTNGTMDFQSFCKQIEIAQYYGRSEYNNEADFDGNWGIYDEPFLQYFADRTTEMPTPWVNTVFTLSSHHPYSIPPALEDIIPHEQDPFLRTIRYADYALKEFFERISTEPWYDSTLFVITADHASYPHQPPTEDFYFNHFKIPLAFFSPKSDLSGEFKGICQQTDILPTILNWVGADQRFLAFGSDLNQQDRIDFSTGYLNGIYHLVTADSVTFMRPNGSLYDQIPVEISSPARSGHQPYTSDFQFLKCLVQGYNSRMIENQLTP